MSFDYTIIQATWPNIKPKEHSPEIIKYSIGIMNKDNS